MGISEEKLARLAHALEPFRGLSLTAISRTGFTCFRFGEWRESIDHKGEVRMGTDHSILVNCPWRVIKGDAFCNFGRDDLTGIAEREGPFWEALFDQIDEGKLSVESWELRAAGELIIGLGTGYALQIMPTLADGEFFWAISGTGTPSALYCEPPDSEFEDWNQSP